MGKLTGTVHGDAANNLHAFYCDQAQELEASGHYFMSAVALALSVESALLVYFLVKFGDDNTDELEIPDSVGFSELVEAANAVGVLSAPIDIPSHVGKGGEQPKHVAQEVIDKIRSFRNLIHPARALRMSYEPCDFTLEQLEEFKEMHRSVAYSLLYFL
jgi:hypothetical protein